MTTYIGTTDDDIFTGTTGADHFDMSQGGNDTVFGNGGADIIYFGAALTADDRIDGGTTGKGHSVLGLVELNGDYSAGLVFGAQTMVNIATLQLDGGFSYDLTLNAATAAGTEFKVDGSRLGAADTLVFDGSADTHTQLRVISRAGHAELTGASFFTIFDMGNTLSADDRLTGSATADVALSGDYSAGLLLGGPMLTHITGLELGAGTYNFTTTDDLATGIGFGVYGSAGATVTFDGSAETDAPFFFNNIKGTLTGGAMGDVFFNDTGTMTSGGGDDQFTNCSGIFHLEDSGKVSFSATTSGNVLYMGGSLDADDTIAFTKGSTNTIVLDGDYSSGLVLGPHTLSFLSNLQVMGGHSYDITVDANTVLFGRSFTVDGSSLLGSDRLVFDGSAARNGYFIITGGAGPDDLTGGNGGDTIEGGKARDRIDGGSGDDTLAGGAGRDVITGGDGADLIVFHAVNESTGIRYDTVVGFDATHDAFLTVHPVTGVDDEIVGGALNDLRTAQFNHQLTNAVDADHLAAGHAVLFAPDSGTLAGHLFLVVDQNGIAGYQANQDLVIEISGSPNIDLLNVGNFH